MADSLWEGKPEEELWKIYRRTREQKLRDFLCSNTPPS